MRHIRHLATFSERAPGWAAAALSWLPVAILIGVSPGWFAWSVLRGNPSGPLLENALDVAARRQALLWVLVSLLAFAVLLGGLALLDRARDGRFPSADRLRRRNDILLGVLLLPIAAALGTARIETTAPFFTLALAGAAGIVACASVYRFPRKPGPSADTSSAPPGTLSPWIPFSVVLLLAAAYGVTASIFSINHHHNLGTNTYDLGIYDNIFFQTLHGHWLGSVYSKGGTHLSAHFEPILVLLSPLYLIHPSAEFLLVLQSFWIAATAIPVYQLTRAQTGRPWLAVALATAVLLAPALHGTNFYDFHTLSLISPFVIWAIFALETGRIRLYWICVAILLLIREDMPLLVMFLGAHAVLGRRASNAGLASMGVALVYLVAVKMFVMPGEGLLMTDSEDSYSFAYYYKDLIPHAEEGAAGLLITVVTNPFYVLRHAFSPPKLLLLGQLLVPVLGLPLFAPRGRLLMLYGLAFLLLASRPQVFTVHFQYTAILFPILFALTAIALGALDRIPLVGALRLEPGRLAGALVAGILATTIATSVKFGALVPNDAFRAGFSRPMFSMPEESRERYRWLRECLELIPRDAALQTTRNIAPHTSNRPRTHVFPKNWGSEWLLIDRTTLGRWGQESLDVLARTDAYETLRSRGTLELQRRRPGMALPERTPQPHQARPWGFAGLPAQSGAEGDPGDDE